MGKHSGWVRAISVDRMCQVVTGSLKPNASNPTVTQEIHNQNYDSANGAQLNLCNSYQSTCHDPIIPAWIPGFQGEPCITGSSCPGSNQLELLPGYFSTEEDEVLHSLDRKKESPVEFRKGFRRAVGFRFVPQTSISSRSY